MNWPTAAVAVFTVLGIVALFTDWEKIFTREDTKPFYAEITLPTGVISARFATEREMLAFVGHFAPEMVRPSPMRDKPLMPRQGGPA